MQVISLAIKGIRIRIKLGIGAALAVKERRILRMSSKRIVRL